MTEKVMICGTQDGVCYNDTDFWLPDGVYQFSVDKARVQAALAMLNSSDVFKGNEMAITVQGALNVVCQDPDDEWRGVDYVELNFYRDYAAARFTLCNSSAYLSFGFEPETYRDFKKQFEIQADKLEIVKSNSLIMKEIQTALDGLPCMLEVWQMYHNDEQSYLMAEYRPEWQSIGGEIPELVWDELDSLFLHHVEQRLKVFETQWHASMSAFEADCTQMGGLCGLVDFERWGGSESYPSKYANHATHQAFMVWRYVKGY